MDKIDYPFIEFLDHVRAMRQVRKYNHVRLGDKFIELGNDECLEHNIARIMDYMGQLYDNEEERLFKGKLLTLMLMYLAENIHDFDTADYAVCASDDAAALVSEHLLRAVHHFFTTKSLQELGHGPSPDEVKELAHKFKEDYAG